MPRSGAATREKILEAAQALVYDQGFAGTSIDKVIARAGITKGAFFYHFKSKAELGRAFIERYAAHDIENFERTMARAEKLSHDPLQQVLIFVGLLQEQVEALPDPALGCLFASYLYERPAYPEDVAAIAVATFDHWRGGFAAKLRAAIAAHPPVTPLDPERLADTLLAQIEGGYVLSKARGSSKAVVEQIGQFRAHLELAFGVTPGAVGAPRDAG